MKLCTNCKIEKPIKGWHKDKKTKDGLSIYCPSCKAEKRKAQYWKKAELNRAKSLEWHNNNLEVSREKKRQYSRNHLAQATIRHQQWVERYPDRRKQVARGYQARRRSAFKIPYTEDQMLARFSLWNFKCWLCKVSPFEAIEHVKPLSKGGWDCLSNIRPACISCNSKKAAAWPYSKILELFGGKQT